MAAQLLRLGVPVVDVLGQTCDKRIASFDTDAAAVAKLDELVRYSSSIAQEAN